MGGGRIGFVKVPQMGTAIGLISLQHSGAMEVERGGVARVQSRGRDGREFSQREAEREGSTLTALGGFLARGGGGERLAHA